MSRFIVMTLSLLVTTTAFAQITATVKGGANLCMENGDAECNDITPGYSFTIAPGYKFHPNVGVTLDANFSSFGTDASGEEKINSPDGSFMSFIPMLHAYIATPSVHVSVGAGVGYSKLAFDLGFISVDASTFVAVKGSVAVLYPVKPNLGIGLAADYTHNGRVEFCVANADPAVPAYAREHCDAEDMISQLQVGLVATYTF